MGSESPPEPIKIGRYTFYYYGPGGGGVCYPDEYFFNLRGKTLNIDFDGPCRNDKTPTPEIKEIERRLLSCSRREALAYAQPPARCILNHFHPLELFLTHRHHPYRVTKSRCSYGVTFSGCNYSIAPIG